jgi:putative transposase
MTDYRSVSIPDTLWFFTVNLAERKVNRLLVDKIELLLEAVTYTKQRCMDAVVLSLGILASNQS